MEFVNQVYKNDIRQVYAGWNHYLIHDNGNIPFCVWINQKPSTSKSSVHIYKQDWNNMLSDSDNYSDNDSDNDSDSVSDSDNYSDNDSDNDSDSVSDYTKLIAEFTPVNVFVGISPLNDMTEYSAGHGLKFEGNSILLHLGFNKYVFIGPTIFSFSTNHEIINFMSPVGNNDVSYPYAIDSQGDYYLLIEDAVIRVDDPEKLDDPYIYYYDKLVQINDNLGIEHIEINEEIYGFDSHPNPSKKYDDLAQRIGSPIYIKYKDQEKRIISKEEYVEILTQYNNSIGLSSLQDYHLIEKRDW